MGRQRSFGEVGLPQVVPQSALSVKNPPDPSKTKIQPKQQESRAPRNRWKTPIVENVHLQSPRELWDKEEWEKIKCAGSQKENHTLSLHGGGEVGGDQSQPGCPTEPPKVQRPCWPRYRRGPRKGFFKRGKRKTKAAVVEKHLPLPPVCQHQHAEHEDWEQELSEQVDADQEDDKMSPFSIDDVLAVALMKLSVEQGKNGCMPSLYNPSVHHMPPVKWEWGSCGTVEGQFSDAEE